MPNNTDISEHLTTELLPERVLERLRRAILTNQLKPGQRLIEEEIARQMGVSRAPVRQAIRILERDGLVVAEPHRGATVADISDQDIEDIYELRTALEIYAIELVVERAKDAEIDTLQDIVDRMRSEANQDPSPDQNQLDLKFHETICLLSANRKLLEAWQRLSSQVRMILSLKNLVYNDWQTLPDGHQRIIDAMRQRDGANAQRVLKEHIAASAKRIRKGLRPVVW